MTIHVLLWPWRSPRVRISITRTRSVHGGGAIFRTSFPSFRKLSISWLVSYLIACTHQPNSTRMSAATAMASYWTKDFKLLTIYITHSLHIPSCAFTVSHFWAFPKVLQYQSAHHSVWHAQHEALVACLSHLLNLEFLPLSL